jgi:hypothetical protein
MSSKLIKTCDICGIDDGTVAGAVPHKLTLYHDHEGFGQDLAPFGLDLCPECTEKIKSKILSIKETIGQSIKKDIDSIGLGGYAGAADR